jgi:hypothetical protein
MRICLVSQQLGTIRTGLGTYANTLVPALVAAGHEAVVVGRGVPPAGVAEFHAVPRVIGDPTPEGWLTFAWLAARRCAPPRCDGAFSGRARGAVRVERRGAARRHGADCYPRARRESWRARYTDWAPRYSATTQRAASSAVRSKLDRLLCNSRYVERALATHYEVRARTVWLHFRGRQWLRRAGAVRLHRREFQRKAAGAARALAGRA